MGVGKRLSADDWTRAALAALADGGLAAIGVEPDLAARLRLLMSHALDGGARVELALQPSAAHPLVAPVLARVTRRRLDYLADVFAGLGFPADAARERSVLAYTAYLGHAQLSGIPDAAPTAVR